MKLAAILFAIVLLSLLSIDSSGQEQEATITTSQLGTIIIHTVNGRQPFDVPERKMPVLVLVQAATGTEISRVEFPGREGTPTELNVTVLRLPGIREPFIVASAVDLGVSDSRHETTILAFVDGKIRDLFPEHLRTNRLPDEGAICLGWFGKQRKLGVLRVNFIWGNDEFHVSPHHYEITQYSWRGSSFEPVRHSVTAGSYRHWRKAIHEKGYDCHINFVAALCPGGF